MDKWLWDQRPAAKYHGLENQGATCYLNSVLQVLFMTDDFRERVKSNTRREHIDSELSDLFDDLEKYNANTYNITKKLKIKNVDEQRDAAEHYEKILRLTNPEASQIFHGELINRNTCLKCKTSTQSEAGFWHLPLSLVHSNTDYSVEKGIEDFFRQSVISGDDQMYCETCDEKCDAVLGCEVKHHPDVLVLLLKRFEFDYTYMTYVKINQPVNVPYTLQIPQSQSYRLYAFVEHFGELRYGHYISKIRSQDDDTWYIFDDSRVVPSASLPEIQRSQSAYLLFYQKQKGDTSVRAALKRSRSPDKSHQGEKSVDVKKSKQGTLSENVDKPGQNCEDEPENNSQDDCGETGEDRKDLGLCSSQQKDSSQEMQICKSTVDNNTVDTKSDDHDITSVMSQASNEHMKFEEEVQEVKRQQSEKTAQQPQLFPDQYSTCEDKTDKISGTQRPDDHSDTGECLGESRSRNGETQENDRGGKDDVDGDRLPRGFASGPGLNCVSENRNGLEQSFITMQTDMTEVQSGKCDQKINEEQGERQESYSVKADIDERGQDQEKRQSLCESTETRNFIMHEKQENNNETRGQNCSEGNQRCEGTQSCTNMKTEKQEMKSDRTETALHKIGKCEDRAEKTTEGDCDETIHRQDVDVSDSSLGQQMYDPDVKMLGVSNQDMKDMEFTTDNSTVDTESDDCDITSVMSQGSKVHVKVEEEVKRQQSEKTTQQTQLFPDQDSTCEDKWDRPDDQSETGACCTGDIRSRNSETLINEKDGEDDVAKRYDYCESTSLTGVPVNSNDSGPFSMTMQANVTSGEHGRTGEEDQAGIRHQSVSEKTAQQPELSSDQYSTYENGSETQRLEDQSDSGAHALAEDRRRNCHETIRDVNEPNPGLSDVSMSRNDLSYMIKQIDERVVHTGRCKQKMDKEQVERQETSPDLSVSVQDQGRTGGTGDAQVKTVESDGLCKLSEETNIKDDEKVKNEQSSMNCHVGTQVHVGIQTETEDTHDKQASKGKPLLTKYDLYLDGVTKCKEGWSNKSQSDMHKLDKSDNLRDRQVSVSSPLQTEYQHCTPNNSVLQKNERSEELLGASGSDRESEYTKRENQSQGHEKRFDGIKKLDVTIDKDTEILRYMPTKKQDITQPNAKHELHEKRKGSDSLHNSYCNRKAENTTDVLAESVDSLTLSNAGGDNSGETMSNQTDAGKDHSDRKMK